MAAEPAALPEVTVEGLRHIGRVVPEDSAPPCPEDEPAVAPYGGDLQDPFGAGGQGGRDTMGLVGGLPRITPALGAGEVRNPTVYGASRKAPRSSRKTGTAGEWITRSV